MAAVSSFEGLRRPCREDYVRFSSLFPSLFEKASPEARRLENRIAGMDCNPYLGIAASLACGYLGLMEAKYPKEEFKGDAYDSDEDIPRGMNEALDLFDEAPDMHAVLGEEFCKVYSAVKTLEYKEFLQVISPWEREHLLLNV